MLFGDHRRTPREIYTDRNPLHYPSSQLIISCTYRCQRCSTLNAGPCEDYDVQILAWLVRAVSGNRKSTKVLELFEQVWDGCGIEVRRYGEDKLPDDFVGLMRRSIGLVVFVYGQTCKDRASRGCWCRHERRWPDLELPAATRTKDSEVSTAMRESERKTKT